MALQDRIRKLTYDDYVLIPDDGQRHEIIDGEHYVTAAPFTRHQRLHARLFGRLQPFIERNELGEVFSGPYDLVLSDHDIVQPDISFVSRERLAILTEKHARGAPDLVVEILSESTRRFDETMKFDLYERVGVQEYWMFDPIRKRARIFRSVQGKFLLVGELSGTAGDILATPLLPGLLLPLSEIFG